MHYVAEASIQLNSFTEPEWDSPCSDQATGQNVRRLNTGKCTKFAPFTKLPCRLSGPMQSPYSNGNGVISRVQKGQRMKVTTHLHEVQRLRMSVSQPLLNLHSPIPRKGEIIPIYFPLHSQNLSVAIICVFFDWNTISCLGGSNCLLSINRHFGSISSLSCAEQVYVLFREIRFMKDASLTCTLNTRRRSLTPKLLQLTEIQGTLPSRELFLVHRLKKTNLCSEGMELIVNARYLYIALSPKSYICFNRVNACNVQHEL